MFRRSGLVIAFTILGLIAVAVPNMAAPSMLTTFGGVTLGAGGDSVVKAFGQPADLSSDFELPQEVAPSGGLTFKLCEATTAVFLVGKIAPFEARVLQATVQGQPCDKAAAFTVDGIGLGATEAELTAKFGPPDREIVRDNQGMKTIAYNSSNAAFSLDGGVVAAISVVFRDNMMADVLVSEQKMTKVQAWTAIGDMRVRGHQFDLARQAFAKVLQEEPKSAVANLRLGCIYYTLGDMTKAQACLKASLAVDPNNPVVIYNMGRVEIASKNYEEGRRLLTKTTALDPSNAAAFNELGLLDENEKKLDDAQKNYKRASELAPSASQPKQNLGRVLLKKGNKMGAIDQYSEALVLELKSPTPNQQVVGALRQALRVLRGEAASSPDDKKVPVKS